MNTRKQRLLSLSCIAVLLLASGCATIEGAGEDIEAAGDEIEEATDS